MTKPKTSRAKYAALLIVLATFVTSVGLLVGPIIGKIGEENATFTFWITNAVALAFTSVLLSLACLLVRDDVSIGQSIAENLLALTLGALAGWALAIYWVPYETFDASVYSKIGGAIALFVSGYGLSKLNQVIDAYLFRDGGPSRHVVTKIGLLLASFALASITIVTNRVEYIQWTMKKCPEVYKSQVEIEMKIQSIKNYDALLRFILPS